MSVARADLPDRGTALQDATARLALGDSLTADETARAIRQMLAEGPSEQAIALLTALAARPETADELHGAATALRDAMIAVPDAEHALCPCGTGGSGLGTFSTSTAVAFVLAACGVAVAKHGNRSASSQCGSADVLVNLGVRLDLTPHQAAALLAQTGLVFLFAPRFHPALGALAPMRRALGFRSIFNAIGPLANPARVERQVLGVAGPARVLATAQALQRLGTHRAVVLAGHDGLDELTLTGPTTIALVTAAGVQVSDLAPADLGLPTYTLAEIAGGSPLLNTQMLRQTLAGEPGPHADLVIANAAMGLWVADAVATPGDGVAMARHALQQGRVLAKLQQLLTAQEAL